MEALVTGASGFVGSQLIPRLERDGHRVRAFARDASRAPAALALRASIVIAAASRSFRFLVRLVERLPVLALPGWRERRTAPVEGRDVVALLAAAATATPPERSLDAVGPDVLTYGEMID